MTSKSGQSSSKPGDINLNNSNSWTWTTDKTGGSVPNPNTTIINPNTTINPANIVSIPGPLTIGPTEPVVKCKGVLETGPHAFTDDMEVWVVQGKKFTHYTFSHICPDMKTGQEGYVPYAGDGIRPAITQVGDRNVCIECGEEFPEYRKLVTMWKMKSIGDSRNGIQSEE